MTEPWRAIESNEPRVWDYFDQLDRWFGRGKSPSSESAMDDAVEWLKDSARFTLLDAYEARITVRCVETDERFRCTRSIVP